VEAFEMRGKVLLFTLSRSEMSGAFAGLGLLIPLDAADRGERVEPDVDAAGHRDRLHRIERNTNAWQLGL